MLVGVPGGATDVIFTKYLGETIILARSHCLWRPSHLVHRIHDPEGQVDSLLLAARVLGDTVEPVLLHGPLHHQERAGEQGEPQEVRGSFLLPQLKHSDRSQWDAGHGGVPAELRVAVAVPTTHVVTVIQSQVSGTDSDSVIYLYFFNKLQIKEKLCV